MLQNTDQMLMLSVSERNTHPHHVVTDLALDIYYDASGTYVLGLLDYLRLLHLMKILHAPRLQRPEIPGFLFLFFQDFY